MNTWFECGIKYPKVMENGLEKKVTEQYLVSAVSFSDAEAQIIEEMTTYINGEFTVSTIKKANYTEVFQTDDSAADLWFKCKVSFISYNEKTGTEKKTNTYMLVQASSMDDATQKLSEAMKGTMSDYQVASIAETRIYDVYFKP